MRTLHVHRLFRWSALVALFLSLGACSEPGPTGLIGTLERDRLELTAESPEPVAELAVKEGQEVEAGQLLVSLDHRRHQALLDQAAAVETRAAQRLAELRRGPRPETIDEARAQLAGTEARLLARSKDFERIAALVSRKLRSPSDMDEARAGRDAARAERDDATAALRAMLNGTTAEELAQATAALQDASASLAALRISTSRLDVTAPVPGTVDELPYKFGERPPQGAVVAVLLARDRVYARIYVPEPIRVHIKPGTAARVHVDGIAEPLPGSVHFVASDAVFTPYFALTERERGRLSYLAEIDVDSHAAAKLPVGIPVSVDFPSLSVR